MTAIPSAEAVALRRWVDEPHTFVRQCIGAEPDPWQLEELRLLPQHDRIAIAGSKGCAKTAFLSWVIWWSLATQPDCKIAAVSTSALQLKDGLWAELAKWHAASSVLQHLFHWGAERIVRKSRPATWFASARSYNRDADPHTQGQSIAGIHGERVAFVLDEAGSVPTVVLNAADAVLATKQRGHQGRLLIGGNTTSPSGALYHAITKQRTLWRVVRVTSDPDDPLRTPRVPVEWAQQQIAAYGRDNPWVRINVFAEFPEHAVGKLLSLADLELAAIRVVEENLREPLVLGVDVGTVTDAAVIYPRRGRLLYEPQVLRGASTIVIASEIVKLAREVSSVTVFIDAGGPGIGVIDQCRLLGLNVVPVFFGAAADDSVRYANKRIEMHVRLAEWIKEGGAIGPSSKCTELVQDLLEPEVGWNLKGQQILEPKDEVKQRLGRSPDWGDGAALTFAYPVAASQQNDDSDPRAIGGRWHQTQPWEQQQQGHDEFGFGG